MCNLPRRGHCDYSEATWNVLANGVGTFVRWDWHKRLIMSLKISKWFCRIKTRAITGLLWRRTLKRLATYHWLTPTCSIPIALFRILLFKRDAVFFWNLLLLFVLPRRAMIKLFNYRLAFSCVLNRALKISMQCFSHCAYTECR